MDKGTRNEIKETQGKRYLILGMNRCYFAQREDLYVKGVLPGRVIEVLQVNPQGDRLIVGIEGQRFSMKAELWGLLDLGERE